jgi:Asp-tRNA(Asn)/Glu-tRNA(Gln) amidotransferase A subunit family amidase
LTDLCSSSAAEIAAQIRRRKISPREVTQAHLTRIDRLNPKLNALTHIDHAGAAKAAEAAEAAVMRGSPLGPLHGVPLTVKSSIDVAGWSCEAGTRLRAGHVPPSDAPLVARLKSAGAIILGNTNTPELLMAYETDNLLYGRTNNPWDLERTPGGSSGGEAAAIAAGLSAGGVGSDGGGSIRIPAHFSGICGLKPTPGRIPATGHFPPSIGPFALIGVVGPMARRIKDLELLFRVMEGPDEGDVCSAPILGRHRSLSQAEIRKIRFGWFDDDGLIPVTQETRKILHNVVGALAGDGFQGRPFRPPKLDRVRELWWNIFGHVGSLLLQRLFAGRGAEASPLMKEFLAVVAAETPLTRDAMLDTLIERDELRLDLISKMRDVPVLLCPVCSVPAFRHGERAWMIGGREVGYLDAMSYTQWFNILGNPSAVVPAGSSTEGLPIGIQVVGRPYEEDTVLAVAAVIEEICGCRCKPPLA